MTRARSALPVCLWLASVLLCAGSLVLGAARSPSDVVLPLAFLSFTTVGALLAARRPRNAVGWIFLASGLLIVLDSFLLAYAGYGGEGRAEPLAGATTAAWLSQWIWTPAVALLGSFLLLLFPDGRLLSRRWRPVLWVAATLTTCTAAVRALAPGELQNLPGVANPYGVGDVGGTLDAVVRHNVGELLSLLVTLVAIASLTLRFRRGTAVEREQLKWFLYAASLLGLGIIVMALTNGGSAGWAVWLAAVFALPIATGIAILRYRLYDIDRVISKTVVYVALTVVLGTAYVGLVLGGQAVFSSFAGGSNLAVAVSTLVVAALFLPVRSRVQRFVDRRFYRRRYDAQRTLEGFGARLREQVDLQTLQAELVGVVGDTMQPAHASLWLRTDPA
jgi:hypothetical protein